MKNIYEKVKSFKEKYPNTMAFRLSKHAKVAEDMLDDDEKVLYAFTGGGVVTYVYVLTNKRIISAHKRLLWGYKSKSYNYNLITNMEVHRGPIWSDISFYFANDSYLYCSALDHDSIKEVNREIVKALPDKNGKSISSEKDSFEKEKSIESNKDKTIKIKKEYSFSDDIEYYQHLNAGLIERYKLSKSAKERKEILEQYKENYLIINDLISKRETEDEMKLKLK